MVNSYYNIHSDNNTLNVTDAGGTSTITIDPGFYSPDDLLLELQSELNGDGTLNQTYTVTVDDVAKAFIIKTADTSSVSLNSGSLMRVIGMVGAQPSVVDTVSTIVLNAIWDLSGRDLIYITAPSLPLSLEINQKKLPVLLELPIDVDLNESINYKLDSPEFHFITLPKAIDIQRIELRLVDKDGVLIDNNGVNWSMTILLKIM